MLTARIKAGEQHIEQIARTKYPETELLRQISGVGPLIALTFVLTVDDPHRKLGILMHRLWVTGDVYEPLRNSQARPGGTRAAA